MKSKEEQLTEKLKAAELNLQNEKAKNKSLQRQNKSLENRLGTSMKQSEALKAACSVLKKTEGLNRTIAQEPIRRHQYPVGIVSPSPELYVRARCGFRGAVDMLSHMNESFGWKLKKIPDRNSIENWVKKSGYSINKELAYTNPEEEHAQTTDESMMPGSGKMQLSLGIGAEKKSDVPLGRSDVKVLDISAASGWNSTGIKAVLSATEKKEGRPSLTKATAGVKVREAMRETGYLLPPRQRTIACFMNLSHTIKWSKNMQRIIASLNTNGKQTFDFVNTHCRYVNSWNRNGINSPVKRVYGMPQVI
ncbi:hypothetical protein Barb6XT_01628 [Bacteroidales bacterium Barb6XT]|nr:hypothetical protein Barb6XT_01628 [Bacteroidales bacterium Barb6XT]